MKHPLLVIGLFVQFALNAAQVDPCPAETATICEDEGPAFICTLFAGYICDAFSADRNSKAHGQLFGVGPRNL